MPGTVPNNENYFFFVSPHIRCTYTYGLQTALSNTANTKRDNIKCDKLVTPDVTLNYERAVARHDIRIENKTHKMTHMKCDKIRDP